MNHIDWTELLRGIGILLALLGASILLVRKDRRETWLILAGVLWTGMIAALSWTDVYRHLLTKTMASSTHLHLTAWPYVLAAFTSLGTPLFVLGFLWHGMRCRARRIRLAELENLAAELEHQISSSKS